MRDAELSRATAAARTIVSSLGLAVDDSILLHNSNKVSLRLMPCNIVARLAPAAEYPAQFEVDLARRLLLAECPVAALDPRVEPRVYQHDDFAATLWTYCQPAADVEISPIEYARALERLHAGMRTVHVQTPHFTDRVEEAQQLVASRDETPALADEDREVLAHALQTLRQLVSGRGNDQLLHGEPHPGNVLSSRNGPVFIDLETCCRGPVEFDIAHAPDAVGELYPNIDRDLVRDCRLLMLAMVTTWRWDRNDEFPNGRRLGSVRLGQLREAIARRGL